MTTDFNSLKDFIAKDLAASKKLNQVRWTVALIVVLIPALVTLTLGYNTMISWRGSWVPWVLALLFAVTIAQFSIGIGKQAGSAMFRVLGTAALIAGFLLPMFSTGFAPMSGYPEFWSETFKCFVFGVLTGSSTGLALAAVVFNRGPIPTAGTRMALSQMAGLAGVVGLFFHCPNSDLVHVLSGHGTQAAAVFLATFFLTERIFIRAVKHQLGAAAEKFECLEKFDR